MNANKKTGRQAEDLQERGRGTAAWNTEKGQSMAADAMAAVLIFIVLGGSLMAIWSSKVSELESQMIENEMKQTSERALNTIVISTGQPTNWEEGIESPESIGLAKRDRVLDERKMNQFIWRTGTNGRSLVSAWHMDEGTGLLAEDHTGSFDCTIMPDQATGPQWQASGCQSGSCLAFNGSTAYLSCGNPAGIAGEITASAWIKPNSVSQGMAILAKGDAQTEGTTSYGLRVDSGGTITLFTFESGSYREATSDSSIPADGQWHFVAAAANTATGDANFYIDGGGPETKAFAGTLPASSTELEIGRHREQTSGPSQYFDGQIDEARVYSRNLDETEIKSLQLWTATFVRVKLLLGGNDYYFRLLDPETGDTMTNSYSDPIEAGTDPAESSNPLLMQSATRRTVTFNGGVAIAELVLQRTA